MTRMKPIDLSEYLRVPSDKVSILTEYPDLDSMIQDIEIPMVELRFDGGIVLQIHTDKERGVPEVIPVDCYYIGTAISSANYVDSNKVNMAGGLVIKPYESKEKYLVPMGVVDSVILARDRDVFVDPAVMEIINTMYRKAKHRAWKDTCSLDDAFRLPTQYDAQATKIFCC